RSSPLRRSSDLGTMVNEVVSFQSQDFSFLISRHFNMHKARTSLSCISDHLIHIKVQRHRTSCNKRRHTHQGFDGRRKFIAKGSSGMELYQPQLLRLYAYSCTDHGMVEMDPDGFRMDGYPSFLRYIGIRYIGLDR